MIAFEDEKPPVSAAELEAAEHELATYRQRIPPSYRAFLAERDGGRPVPDCFVYEKDNEERMGSVDGFLGVGEVPAPQVNLLFSAGVLQGRIVPGVLPVADTPTGNKICIDTRDGRDGPMLLELYINQLPCGGPWGCDKMLPRMLPEGSELVVRGPDGSVNVYTGLAE